MKNLFILLLLLPLFAVSQPPVKVVNDIDLETQIKMEWYSNASAQMSRISPSSYAGDGTTTPSANGTAISTGDHYFFAQLAPISKCLYVRNLIGWSSQDCIGQFTIGSKVLGALFPAGKTVDIQFNDLAYPKETISGAVSKYLSTPGGNIVTGGSAQMWYGSADLNFAATSPIWIIGDSNTEGTAVSTSIASDTSITKYVLWDWKIRQWYNNRGNNVRLIDWSFSGQGSTFIDNLLTSGRIDLGKTIPKLIIYDMCTNDASSTTLATNVTKFIGWALNRYPLVKIIITSGTPTQTSAVFPATPAQQSANRTALAAVVATINKSNVIFIDTGGCFSSSDNTQYSGTEATGSQIHLSKIGQQTKATFVITTLTNTYPSFLTL